MRDVVRGSLPALLVLGLSSVALAQDVEPNGSCARAQDLGRVDSTLAIRGSLDAKDAEPVSDVDYFRLSAEPGRRLSIKGDAKLSLASATFDDQCSLTTFGSGPGGEAQIGVPASGVVFVAVGDPSDAKLDGNGAGNPGAYELTASLLPGVAFITGNTLDAETRAVIPGADVQLEQCLDLFCDLAFPVASQRTAELGQFFFERDAFGRDIPGGTFRLTARAAGYADAVSILFKVDEDEGFYVGDVFLRRLSPASAVPPDSR